MARIGLWSEGLPDRMLSFWAGHNSVRIVNAAVDTLHDLDGLVMPAEAVCAAKAALLAHKNAVAPLFFPVLVVAGDALPDAALAEALETADDMVRLSATPVEAAGRLRCLLAARDRSLAAVSRTVHANRLQDRACNLVDAIAAELEGPVQYLGDNLVFLGDGFAQVMRTLDELAAAAMDAGHGGHANGALLVGRLASLLSDEELHFVLEEIPEAVRESREGLDRLSGLVAAGRRTIGTGLDAHGPADVALALEDAALLTRHAWQDVVALTFRSADGLPPVTVPAGLLRLALVSLVLRAIRLAVGPGEDARPAGSVRLYAGRAADRIEVVVEVMGAAASDHEVEDDVSAFVGGVLAGHGAGIVRRASLSDSEGGREVIALDLPCLTASQTHSR